MRATIIGAGIAGPVLGLFLRRLGVEVTIYEARTPRLLDFTGAFVAIPPNGMNVLKAAGVAERVQAVGDVCDGFDVLNADGRHIVGLDDVDHAERYGSPLLVVRRAQFTAVLVDAVRAAGAEIHFGARLVDLEQDERRVTAFFSNGADATSDFLVGCDGLRSATRALALPDAPEPSFGTQLDYGGFARFDDAPLEVGRNVMVFGRRAVFAAFRASDGEILWFHGGIDDDDAETDREHVLAAHADDAPWIREIIERTPRLLGPWPRHASVALDEWSSGRVCVIGDAAHAVPTPSGQGAAMALEDAMMLARCFETTWNPERAFELLVDRRRARVDHVVKQSRRMGAAKIPRSGFGAWVRDRMFPLMIARGAEAKRALYDYRVEVAPTERHPMQRLG